MDIDPNYVSPHVRWSLLIQDYPEAKVTYRLQAADAMGVPPEFQTAKTDVCVATITLPDGRVFEGYRSVDTVMGKSPNDPRTPEGWNTLCTKAMGRACKAAGYPGNTQELRQVILWRQRVAEQDAIRAGIPLPANRPAPTIPEPRPTATAQQAAAEQPPAHLTEGQGTEDPAAPPSPETATEGPESVDSRWLERLGGLDDEVYDALAGWCAERELNIEEPNTRMIAWLDHLEAATA